MLTYCRRCACTCSSRHSAASIAIDTLRISNGDKAAADQDVGHAASGTFASTDHMFAVAAEGRYPPHVPLLGARHRVQAQMRNTLPEAAAPLSSNALHNHDTHSRRHTKLLLVVGLGLAEREAPTQCLSCMPIACTRDLMPCPGHMVLDGTARANNPHGGPAPYAVAAQIQHMPSSSARGGIVGLCRAAMHTARSYVQLCSDISGRHTGRHPLKVKRPQCSSASPRRQERFPSPSEAKCGYLTILISRPVMYSLANRMPPCEPDCAKHQGGCGVTAAITE